MPLGCDVGGQQVVDVKAVLRIFRLAHDRIIFTLRLQRLMQSPSRASGLLSPLASVRNRSFTAFSWACIAQRSCCWLT